MSGATDALITSAENFAQVWSGALNFAQAAGGEPDPEADSVGMSDSGLLESLKAGFATKRENDALLARLAAQVVERSRPSLGQDGLAKRTGNTSAAMVLTETGHITLAEASRLCRVGDATATPVSLLGERLRAPFPAVARALSAGRIPVDAAEVIISNLEQARQNAGPDDLAIAEEGLVEFAAENPADLVRKLAIRTRDHLDTDGIEPREEQLVAKRGWQRINRRDGMVRYVFDADPLSAGYVDAWMDAHLGAAIRGVRMTEKGSTDTDPDDCDDNHEQLDNRTFPQLGADAIVALLRHGLSCPQSMGPSATTTMIVRIGLDELMTGLGEAQIDGIEQPISAGTVRRLAAEAEIIPMVLGGDSEVLDLGPPAACSAGRNASPWPNATMDAPGAADPPATRKHITSNGGRLTAAARTWRTGYCCATRITT
ncbi:DUF222 domain-containing protein [Glaciibacter sp. 2TAF33]|uniref:DUF222 domain-containing protein n=1 Tax=Glaciibacter sp. 2TAF33 TaxID=3233015 RepID=UPI003F919195